MAIIDLMEHGVKYDEALERVKFYVTTLDGKGVVKRIRRHAKSYLFSDGVLFRRMKDGPMVLPKIEARMGVLRGAYN